MKTAALLLLGLSLLVTGCKSPGITKSFVQTAVSTGVGFGVIKEPGAIPYLRVSAEVICSAAHGTNLSPAAVVAALEEPPAAGLKTPGGVIILNGVIGIYTAIFEEFGDDVQDRPFLKAALEGTCEGIKMGLPPAKPTFGVAPGAASKFASKPHIK